MCVCLDVLCRFLWQSIHLSSFRLASKFLYIYIYMYVALCSDQLFHFLVCRVHVRVSVETDDGNNIIVFQKDPRSSTVHVQYHIMPDENNIIASIMLSHAKNKKICSGNKKLFLPWPTHIDKYCKISHNNYTCTYCAQK